MDPLETYWNIKLDYVKKNLLENGFDAFVVPSRNAAKDLVMGEIIPALKPSSIAFGGSMTVVETGVYEAVKSLSGIEVIDTYDNSPPPEERIERRKRALLVDLFITGTNAVVEGGQLVNLDGMGNRVAALAFGPKSVLILCGRNKIAQDLESAFMRVKHYAAPANAMRLSRKTPCTQLSYCDDCSSPERICNVWSIIEKSAPKGRIKIILINEEMGL
ncbi:MAG: lactate utilization protein [Syntrophobacterales bacterium]|nr:lactate utilization protein [Syntrophobacterales bacterium]